VNNEDEILIKLKKLLRLSEQGIGGEAANASAFLEKMMLKYNVTMQDLADEERETKWFFYGDQDWHRMLMIQILASVSPPEDYFKTWRKPGKKHELCIGAEVTKAEEMEIRMKYDAYNAAYAVEVDNLYQAFLHRNDIFRSGGTAKKAYTDEEIRQMRKIRAMMENMDTTTVRKALETR